MAAQNDVLLVTDDSQTGNLWITLLHQRFIEAKLINANNIPSSVTDMRIIILDMNQCTSDYRGIIAKVHTLSSAPIFLLTYNYDERSLLKAYEMGITDYIIKPISPKLFVVKVESWLNLIKDDTVGICTNIRIKSFNLDVTRRELHINNKNRISLTKLEGDLLRLLMAHAGQAISSETIASHVWGNLAADTSLVKHVIYRLRRKIEINPREPKHIVHVPVGYVFKA